MKTNKEEFFPKPHTPYPKPKHLCLLLALALFQISFSQETEDAEKKIRFGARAGGGLAASKDQGFGLGAGVFALIPVSSIHFSPNISFEYRKIYAENEITETAVEIPLIIRFNYKKENLIYMGIGPLFGFVLSSKMDFPDEHAYEYSRSGLDFGIATELGFRISDNLSIDVRALGSFNSSFEYKHNYNDSDGHYNSYSDKIDDVFYQLKIGFSYLF